MEKMQTLLHIIDLMLITSICAHGAYYFPVQLQELQFYLNVRFYCRFCRTDDGEKCSLSWSEKWIPTPTVRSPPPPIKKCKQSSISVKCCLLSSVWLLDQIHEYRSCNDYYRLCGCWFESMHTVLVVLTTDYFYFNGNFLAYRVKKIATAEKELKCRTSLS